MRLHVVLNYEILIMRKSLLLIFALILFLSTSTFAQKKKAKDNEEASTEQEDKHFLDTLGLSAFKFRCVGPALTSGRVSDIAVHPENRSVYYVATSSGGVWKTTNSGTTYKPIFDSQGSYSIGCVTMDPNNHNTIWIGSGENNNQRSVAYGDGVYRSDDGGSSWKNVGLKDSEHIGKIIVHPDHSDVVYVAAIGPLWSEGGDRGVYKTTDGGETWDTVLYINEHTGVTDLVMDPRDPDVLYAAAFQRRRHVFTYVGGGMHSGIYKTVNGGETWEKANKGLPGVDKGRIGLSIAPSDPEIIYAMVEAAQGKSGFYKSTNRGASWQKQGGHVTSGNYYVEIITHPTNPDVIFSMDTWLQVSRDGGKTFKRLGEQWKHVDNHSMWIDPDYPDYYLVGCDGGIYESFDGAKTWSFKANLPITQFYKVAVDNSLPFYYIYGGTQDNFSLGGPSRTINGHGIMNEDWFITHGGDGFESQVDPNNPNIVYAQSQYGVLVRYDRLSGEETGIQPKPKQGEPAFRWNWDAPLAVSEHLDTRIYFAANKLFKSDDRGNTWDEISPDLTRQIDRNTLKVMGRVQSIDAVAKNRSTSPYGTIVAFSESPLNENLLYVGTDDGLIQVTEDGGQNWREIGAFPDVPDMTYVNMLIASQHDENVVYAAFNNHKRGDFQPYVYKSTDKGLTWSSITNNLPERGSSYSIAEDHLDPNLLFVGTEFSCFVTVDGGGYWKKLSAGLPTIAVRDIAIQKRENDLVLGTFGRGFYVLDDYSALRNVKEDLVTMEAKLFDTKDGLLYNEALPLGLRGNAFLGHELYAAKNPPVGVTFTYYLKDSYKSLEDQRRDKEKKAIKGDEDTPFPTYEELQAEREETDPYILFTIKDQDGQIVRKITGKVSKGIQRITWDGYYPSKRPVRLSSSSFDNPFAGVNRGIMAAPGDYTVTLSKNVNGTMTDLVLDHPFAIRSLGELSLPAENREDLVAFESKVAEMQRRISGAQAVYSSARNTMRHIAKAVTAADINQGELIDDIESIDNDLDQIAKAMYGDNVASRLDQPSQMGIAGRLGWLTYGLYGSTSAPTTTQRDALRIVEEEFPAQLANLKTVQTKIQSLEEKLEAAGAPYTPGREVLLNGMKN